MKTDNHREFPLTKINFILLAIGFVIILIGFALMSGGASTDPNVFSPEIFSFRRIVLSTIVLVFGFGFEIFAILYRPKKEQKQ